jgi:hypothetical protein
VFLEYLYTGDIPNATLMNQYGVALAKNAHYADCEELYSACIDHLVHSWRDAETVNASRFAADMTTLVMEDVLSKMKPDAVEDKILFMAAAYSTVNNDDWTQCVLQHVSNTMITTDLTALLVKLHDISANRSNEGLANVLDLIPSAYTVAASQSVVQKLQKKLASATMMALCSRCKRYVTRYQAEHDPGGCVIKQHTGQKLRDSNDRYVYSCCLKPSEIGCAQRLDKHEVYAGSYRSY